HVDVAHRRALPPDELAGEFQGALLAVVLDLAPHPLGLELPLENEQKLLADGLPLREIVPGAQAHRLNRALVVWLAREHDDDLVRPELANLLEHLDAALVGEPDVEEDQIHRLPLERGEAGLARFGGLNLEPLRLEVAAQEVADRFVVVN